MCRDCYELDLPEPSWLEDFRENKETYTFMMLSVGIPTGLFILSIAVIKIANEKVKSL